MGKDSGRERRHHSGRRGGGGGESKRQRRGSRRDNGGRGGAGGRDDVSDSGTGSRGKRHSRRPTRTRSRRKDDASESSDSSAKDDSVGHFKGEPGDPLGERYVIECESGVGTFGKVFACRDRTTGAKVAIKVVRRVRKYTESAHVEADVLRRVNRADVKGNSLCVRFYGSFEYRGHVCLVFEQLGSSLYEYSKALRHRPMPLYCVQAFSEQLLRAIAFMRDIRLVHTDLKPENVLLRVEGDFSKVHAPTMRRDGKRSLAPLSTEVRVIDFGGATFEDAHHSRIINTRQYRSPEVILGLSWSYPSDVWSAACIIMEMYRGELLFQTHDTVEHLALMEKLLGHIPSDLARRANREAREYFDSAGRLQWPELARSRSSEHAVTRQRTLRELIHEDDDVFLDLMSRMLTFDPARRITAADALRHTFFTSVRDASSLDSLRDNQFAGAD